MHIKESSLNSASRYNRIYFIRICTSSWPLSSSQERESEWSAGLVLPAQTEDDRAGLVFDVDYSRTVSAWPCVLADLSSWSAGSSLRAPQQRGQGPFCSLVVYGLVFFCVRHVCHLFSFDSLESVVSQAYHCVPPSWLQNICFSVE